jgi:hypothetical protein
MRTTIFSCPSARSQITPPTSRPSLLLVPPRTRSTHHAHTALLNWISIIISAAESFLVSHLFSVKEARHLTELYPVTSSTLSSGLDETCTCLSCFPQVYQVHLDQCLQPKFYNLPRPWSVWGSSPAMENSHGRTGNRTRDLMVLILRSCTYRLLSLPQDKISLTRAAFSNSRRNSVCSDNGA